MVLNDVDEEYATRSTRQNKTGVFSEMYQKTLQDTGFEINNTTFDNENILIFDVKAFYAFFIQLFNPSPTVSVNYKIDFATLETALPADLDFTEEWFELVPEKTIATQKWSNATLDALKNISEFVRATPKITFIRISLKLSGATPTIITGVLSGV